jgi:arthrofactin-type cyclic lipopeptide synthetase B
VARGYRCREELTAERFRRDPFSQRPGARMYATGDLVRRRADGRVEYLGRLDQQVKLRGFRIELGEIEAALRAQQGILDAAVDLREFGPGDQRLVAWFVAAPGADPGEAELREGLARTLPEYMIPNSFERLVALPRTHNGKLDRKALAPAKSPQRKGEFVEPRGEVELAVAETWRGVLGLQAVGARDRFFDLGGHSLLAMRAITQLEARFGVRVPPRDLMLQNLGQLAGAIEERRAVRHDAGGPATSVASATGKSTGVLGALRNLLGKRPEGS